MSWPPASGNVGVAGYDIYRDGAKLASTTGTGYADTSMLHRETYRYTVDAYDAPENISTTSLDVSLTCTDTTPPSAPTKLTATLGYRRITLSGAASVDNVGIAGYYVHRMA